MLAIHLLHTFQSVARLREHGFNLIRHAVAHRRFNTGNQGYGFDDGRHERGALGVGANFGNRCRLVYMPDRNGVDRVVIPRAKAKTTGTARPYRAGN